MLQILMFIMQSIFTIGTPVLLLILLKDEIKCNIKNAYIIWGLYFVACFFSDIIVPDSAMVMLLINILCIIIPAIIFRKNLANTYIFWFCIITVENIIGNVMTALIAIITDLLSDGRADWLNLNDMSVPAVLTIGISMLLSLIIAYFICGKIKYIVMNLKGFLKYSILIIGVGVWIMNSLLKPVININYNEFPSGILLFFDAVCFTTGSVAVIIFSAMHIRNSRAENLMIKQEIDKEEEKYRKNLELQKQLRILNHEVRNYLNAGNPEIRKNIDDYCDTILNEQELMD